jgi:hypothetical protein
MSVIPILASSDEPVFIVLRLRRHVPPSSGKRDKPQTRVPSSEALRPVRVPVVEPRPVEPGKAAGCEEKGELSGVDVRGVCPAGLECQD